MAKPASALDDGGDDVPSPAYEMTKGPGAAPAVDAEEAAGLVVLEGEEGGGDAELFFVGDGQPAVAAAPAPTVEYDPNWAYHPLGRPAWAAWRAAADAFGEGSVGASVFVLLSATLGAGTLAFPFAFKECGWGLAFLLMVRMECRAGLIVCRRWLFAP